MALDDAKKFLIQHDREPSDDELSAFEAICLCADQIVMTPVVVNGQDRFAFALMRENEAGEHSLEVIALLLLPQDQILREEGAVRPICSKQDLN